MDQNEYQDIFMAESREYLQYLNEALLSLEKDPNDEEAVQQMFRSAHSLKGMAATMGYDSIASLTHTMENVLQRLRDKTLAASESLADILFHSLDTLEKLLAHLETPKEEEPQVDSLVKKLEQIQEGRPIDTKTDEKAVSATAGEDRFQMEQLAVDAYEQEIIKEAKMKGESVYAAEIFLKKDALLKSVRAFMVLRSIEELGVLIKTYPSAQDLEEDRFAESFVILLHTGRQADEIKNKIVKTPDIESIEIHEFPSGLAEENDEASQKADKALERDPGMELATKTNGNKSNHPVSASKKEKTVRVETEKLDRLINLVGELVINRTRLVGMADSQEKGGLKEATEQLDRITSDLQNAIMKLRMVPIKQVFDRFPRMVRDLAKEEHKRINLVIQGEDTELDRSIVNQIGDPLVHLLRNAVDHGIETEEDRLQKGKEAVAKILLEARHEGSYVAIEVSDDGSGLDPKKLKDTAVKKGIITQEEAASMDEREAFHLMFKNGFSTSETITDVSGRGVGMDAVKKIIEGLNGLVDVQSAAGEGTNIIIRLPLTLAIIKALLVKTNQQVMAIPLENVKENLLVKAEDIRYVKGEKAISVRDEIVPLASLHEKLSSLKEPKELSDKDVSVVVMHVGDKKAGFIVDQMVGQQEVVIKPLGDMLGKLKGIAGATVLGNGEVALILNVATLI